MKPDSLLQEQDAKLSGWREPVVRMQHAIERGELVLYCQTIAALAGPVRYPMAEVLVRLREEAAALMPPGEFLPVFEHYRMMPALDRWVVRRAVRFLAAGSRIPSLSINLSSQTIQDVTFPGSVAQALMESGVPGGSLLFEIDETSLLAHPEAVERFGNAMNAIGCRLMIDGFGRCAVSFAPLKRLRVAEAIGFGVIAEMVEDQDIVTRLKALGVSHAQGFGIHQPQPIAGFAAA